MKMQRLLVRGTLAMALAAGSAYPAAAPDAPGIPAQMVVTVVSDGHGQRPATLQSGELSVLENKTSVPVVGFERLAGDSAAMQLFVLLDDSTRSSSLGTQLRDLKGFLESLPATTQVAVGYMRNGTFALAQSFTTDHQKAANSLRLPLAVPGENGSPYFALSELVQRWPSHEPTGRRAVLMFTDGVDRYFSQSILDDPYVDAAFHAAQKRGVLVYSVYLRGAGLYGRGSWTTNIAQSRLMEVSDETGGYAYFQDLTDPVSISPFLDDLQNRFDNQYQVTIRAQSEKGFQPVKLRTELPGAKVSGPAHIYVP